MIKTDPLYKDLLLFFYNSGRTIPEFIEKHPEWLRLFKHDYDKLHSRIRDRLRWLRYRSLIRKPKTQPFDKPQQYELRKSAIEYLKIQKWI